MTTYCGVDGREIVAATTLPYRKLIIPIGITRQNACVADNITREGGASQREQIRR